MAKLSQPIDNLLGGVSQQPASQRPVTASESEVNTFGDVASGLYKRPPTQHVVEAIASTFSEDVFVHWIDISSTQQYVMVIEDDDLHLFDLNDTGAAETVTFPDGKLYLNSATPRADFRAYTTNGRTYITNRTVTCAMSGVNNSDVLTGTVQTFADLPGAPSTGHIYLIRGDVSTSADSYYVKFDGTTWEEYHQPGIDDDFDTATLPHELTHSGGTFTFQEVAYPSRTTGGSVSAATPSFIGVAVWDIYFLRSRLGFVIKQGTVCGRSKNTAAGWTNFWPASVQAVIDSDPIDKTVPDGHARELEHASVLDDVCYLWSEKGVFVFAANAESTLTPSSAFIRPAPVFTPSKQNVKPLVAGDRVYFAQHATEYHDHVATMVGRKSSVLTQTLSNYVPAGAYAMASNDRMLAILTSGDENRVYIQQFLDDEGERLHESWRYWEFDSGAEIKGLSFVDGFLWFVIQHADGVYLEKMQFGKDAAEVSVGVLVHLDRCHLLTGSYSSVTDLTTFTTSYDIPAGVNPTAITSGDWGVKKGVMLSLTRTSATTATVSGDWSADTCFVGIDYTAEYEFSEQFRRSRNPSGDLGRASLEGRLQLSSIVVRHVDTGYYRVEVTGTGRTKMTKACTSQVLGVNFAPGSVNLVKGACRTPVMGRSSDITIKLINDTWMPSRWVGAEWYGTYSARRVV